LLWLFQWFRLIVENRPNYSEDVAGLGDINDIRNGVFAAAQIRNGFDPRHIVVLKVCHIYLPVCPFSDPYVTANPQTPNNMLSTKDIPPRHDRGDLPEGVSYPGRSHYTLQWLVSSGKVTSMVPNNSDSDAAFKKRTGKRKPLDLLLHYNYGAAAVKCWGRGSEVLQNLANPPCPPVPVPAPTGPLRTTHDKSAAIHDKCNEAWAADGAGTGKW